MLLKQVTLRAIADGRVALAFRRWKRPTVKAGGTLHTPIGLLAIEAVDQVALNAITLADARAAGFDDLKVLTAELRRREGSVYRIALRLAGADPRIALRARLPEGDELEQLSARLARLDAASPSGPWTGAALTVIARRPGVRAPELAAEVGLEKDRFKANVRKLKTLGLTESLKVGYRLSPRGEAVLEG